MRVTSERNLAFKDQPRPIGIDKVSKVVGTAQANKVAKFPMEFDLGVASTRNVAVSVAGDVGKRGALRISTSPIAVGKHVLPPSIKVKEIKPRGDRSEAFSRPLVTSGLYPPHLDRTLSPKKVPKALIRPSAIRTGEPRWKLGGSEATTIFPPDDRRVFFDTSYPWSTCGQVLTPGGSGSGVMVGPRHLLTVSHAIAWGDNNTAGWVRFTPMLFDTSTPFGEAWGTTVYSKRKITDHTLGWIDEQYDYVVVVLDRRIGDLTGWMGARGYTDDWDGGDYWSHVGYPGDIGGTLRPSFQTGISLNGIWYELDSHEAMSHSADVWPGQSGGPFFGWWSKENYPSAVSVQSTQNSDENKCSGGQDMVDLILEAIADFP